VIFKKVNDNELPNLTVFMKTVYRFNYLSAFMTNWWKHIYSHQRSFINFLLLPNTLLAKRWKEACFLTQSIYRH